jgi:uncharacterized membrane protein
VKSKLTIGSRQIEYELLVVWITVIIYIVTFSTLSVIRHNTLHTVIYDMGIFSQVIWNTAHGRWFETSLGRSHDVSLIGNYLGNHVRPMFLLLAPFYRLWPDPRQLLILQSIALGLGGPLLYHIARRKIGRPTPALVITLVYLLYPALGFLNLNDFHPMALTIPLLLLAYWARLEKRSGLFWISIVLALAAKEEMVIPIGTWGLIISFQKEERRKGVGMMALAGAWAILSFGVVIPHFQGRPYRFWEMWAHLPILRQFLNGTREVATPSSNFSPGLMLLWLIHLFLPLGFLPFLGPQFFLVALPSLFYLLAANEPRMYMIGFQYPAVLIPWFFLAIVEGLRWLRRTHRRRLYRLGLVFMIAGTVGTNILANPIYRQLQAGSFWRDLHYEQMVTALEMIPPDASVSTINRLGPQLVHRRELISFELPAPFRLDHVTMADYILLDLVDCHTADTSRENRRTEYSMMVTQVLETRLYRVRYWSERILLLERGTPSDEQIDAVLDYVNALLEEEHPCWP